MPTQACVSCHFWIQRAFTGPQLEHEIILPVSAENRSLARKRDFSWTREYAALACSRMVWDEGFDFDKSKRYEELVSKNRKDYCFFLEYKEGMLLPAAETLQERQAQLREASRDRRLTIVGLWIATFALLVSAVLGFLQFIAK